jgi:hypothetical protein
VAPGVKPRRYPITRNNSTVLGHYPRSPAWDRWWRLARWADAYTCEPPHHVLNVPCGGPDADGAVYRVRPLKGREERTVPVLVDGVWCWEYRTTQPPPPAADKDA